MTQTDQPQQPQDQSGDETNVQPLHPEQAADATTDAAGELEGLKAALADAQDKMMRALAEAENTRRRAVKEREDAGKFAIHGFAKDLLDFSDNFHRALASIPEELHADERVSLIIQGLKAMDSNLLKTFERHGIQKIEPLDQVFNPNFHEVMFETVIPGKPAGTVFQVIEAGYVLNGRLLRAAKVGVTKAEDGQTNSHQVDVDA